MIFCPYCGAALPDGAVACGMCGNTLDLNGQETGFPNAEASMTKKKSILKKVIIIVSAVIAVLGIVFLVFALISRSTRSVRNSLFEAIEDNDWEIAYDVLSPNYDVGSSERDIKESIRNQIDDCYKKNHRCLR